MFEKRRYSWRRRECKIENPRLTEVLKFLKIADWISVIVKHKRPIIFGNPQIEEMIRDGLAQRTYQDYANVYIEGHYPLATSNVINMFPGNAKIVVSAIKGTMAKLSTTALRKVRTQKNEEIICNIKNLDS